MYRVMRVSTYLLSENKTSSSVSTVESDVYLVVSDNGTTITSVARATNATTANQIATALNAA